MEDVLKEGKTRSIGVSNYMIDEMTEMLETAKVSQEIYTRLPLSKWLQHAYGPRWSRRSFPL